MRIDIVNKNYIDDCLVKSLIRSYHNGNNNAKKELIGYLYPYIYQFPQDVFSMNSILTCKFHEDILSRFEKIINSYKENNFKFSTWFYRVLFNAGLNVIRSSKESNDEVLMDPTIYDFNNLSYIEPETAHENVLDLFDVLSCKEKMIMKVRYPDFLDKKDLVELSEISGRTIKECICFYLNSKQICLIKNDKNKKKLDEISRLYNTKLRIRKYLSYKTTDERSLLLNKIKKIDLRRGSLVRGISNNIAVVPNQDISTFFNYPYGTVTAIIFRAKNKIKAKYGSIYQKDNEQAA